MAIDVGLNYSGSGNGNNGSSEITIYSVVNSANATGILNQVRFYPATFGIIGFTVGTFLRVSGTTTTSRDYESLGDFSCAEQIVSDVNIDVELGDYVGYYHSGSGALRYTSGDTRHYRLGNYLGTNNISYNSVGGYYDLLYATGTETATGGSGILAGSILNSDILRSRILRG